jgi:hypothetical protein
MSAEHKNAEQNALAAKINQYWTDFKQGKLIGYKTMAVILILVAAVGSTVYIMRERAKANSQEWVALEEANTETSLQEISKSYPNTIQDRLARLQIARQNLGIAGIDRLGSISNDQRKKAIDNIEKARESFGKLLDEFKNDPVFKAECLLALAKAEAALVAVPAKEGQLTEFKGSIPKVVGWLDQLSETAAPDTAWAIDAKKFADSLRDQNSPTSHEFLRVEQALFRPIFGDGGLGTEPTMPGMSPFPNGLGGFPRGPIIPGVPEPINPAKGPGVSNPGGPMPPLPPGPKGPESTTPKESGSPIIATPPKTPDTKAPDTPNIPPPLVPEPKAPSKSPETTPKAPEPKAPDSKQLEPKAPAAPPEKKPG